MLDKKIVEYSPKPRRKAKATLSEQTEKTVRWLIVTLTSLIVVLAVSFFIFTGESAQKGYTLAQEKIKNELLNSELENINAKISTSVNFSDLDQNSKVQTMSQAENKTFVTAEDNAVK